MSWPGSIGSGFGASGLIVVGSLAHRQTAPDFHHGFGLLDILEECPLAVIAPPTASFEQFGKVLQPLFCKLAPARKNVALTRHVQSLCHDPAREEENGRRRNATNQLNVTEIFCGKLLHCPVGRYPARRTSTKDERIRGCLAYFTGKPVCRHDRSAETIDATTAAPSRSAGQDDLTDGRNERPVRGDNRTGQAIWALGWMGARAEYSLVGRGLPPLPL